LSPSLLGDLLLDSASWMTLGGKVVAGGAAPPASLGAVEAPAHNRNVGGRIEFDKIESCDPTPVRVFNELVHCHRNRDIAPNRNCNKTI
jgi:hypothetical protein